MVSIRADNLAKETYYRGKRDLLQKGLRKSTHQKLPVNNKSRLCANAHVCVTYLGMPEKPAEACLLKR